MDAARFNSKYPIGAPVVYDPAPLLGEPSEICEVLEAAFDQDDGDPQFPVVLWTGVKIRRPNGEEIIAHMEGLVLI